MIRKAKRLILDTPLTLIHMVGGLGAAVLAFILTLNGHGLWVVYPIMFTCLLPDSLYGAYLILE